MSHSISSPPTRWQFVEPLLPLFSTLLRCEIKPDDRNRSSLEIVYTARRQILEIVPPNLHIVAVFRLVCPVVVVEGFCPFLGCIPCCRTDFVSVLNQLLPCCRLSRVHQPGLFSP